MTGEEKEGKRKKDTVESIKGRLIKKRKERKRRYNDNLLQERINDEKKVKDVKKS